MKANLYASPKARALLAVLAILGAALLAALFLGRAARPPRGESDPAIWRDRRSTPQDRRNAYDEVLRKLRRSPTLEVQFVPWMSAAVEAQAWLQGERVLAVRCVLDPKVLQLYLGGSPTGLRRDPSWGDRVSILLLDTDGDSEPDRFRQPAEEPTKSRPEEGGAPVRGTGLGVLWDASLAELGKH